MNAMKMVALASTLIMSGAAWSSEPAENATARYEGLQHRITQACASDPQGDVCQIYLHGVLHGVEATGEQVEQLAAGWAELHERADRQHPFAWLARDILHAASCSPDALTFLNEFEADKQRDVASQAGDHVGAHCQPLWSQHRLEPPTTNPYILTQR